jgi:hypothetical protein
LGHNFYQVSGRKQTRFAVWTFLQGKASSIFSWLQACKYMLQTLGDLLDGRWLITDWVAGDYQ